MIKEFYKKHIAFYYDKKYNGNKTFKNHLFDFSYIIFQLIFITGKLFYNLNEKDYDVVNNGLIILNTYKHYQIYPGIRIIYENLTEFLGNFRNKTLTGTLEEKSIVTTVLSDFLYIIILLFVVDWQVVNIVVLIPFLFTLLLVIIQLIRYYRYVKYINPVRRNTSKKHKYE